MPHFLWIRTRLRQPYVLHEDGPMRRELRGHPYGQLRAKGEVRVLRLRRVRFEYVLHALGVQRELRR